MTRTRTRTRTYFYRYVYKGLLEHRYSDTFSTQRQDSVDNDEKLNVTVDERILTGSSETRTNRNNSKAVLLRLPRDIVVEIFLLAQVVSDDTLALFRSEKDKVPKASGTRWCWLTVTHICRDWRSIAIGTQELWVHIDTTGHASAEQTAVYLERSGSAPLYVYCGNSNATPSIDVALTHMHRIRELYVFVLSLTQEMQTLLLENEAPILERLSLLTLLSVPFDARLLFGGHCPRLRSLALGTNSPLWGRSPIVQNLSDLCGGFCHGNLTLKEIFSVLEKNLTLERFWIMVVPSGTKSDSRSKSLLSFKSPIRLHHLKDLDIKGASYEELACFFRNVDMPELDGWDIRCAKYPIRRAPRVNPRAVFPNGNNSNMTCSSLELAVSPAYVEIAADFGDVIKQWESRHLSPLRRVVRFSWDTREAMTMTESFDFICYTIDGGFWCKATKLTVNIEAGASSAGDLFLGGDLERASAPWVQLLGMFPNVQDVTVRRCLYARIEDDVVAEEYRGFLEALVTASEDGWGRISVIFPNLNTLCLHGVNLETGLTNLLEILRVRVSRCKRLCRLRIGKPFGLTDEIVLLIEGSGVADNIEILEKGEEF